ncbi:hypothetical protein BCR36DRAFT_414255 [Piromyces finnis]|uniref:MI domain-containing protein n=1 Tax=Piromyces finnis TaxID=1754191 RepID=A0A1Y1V2Q5_9FUNG|nr:hypothetical protein BCR36DRAFT_414255 [Piromyces finnis]|eukprot:ORX45943.1 hypothetical protein BCR36DRAFT_414255 [Piromyces finnis]
MAVGMKNNKRQNRKRKINDTTLLSDSFKEELNSRANDDNELNERFNFRFNKKILNRKKDRKKARELKKQLQREHSLRRKQYLQGGINNDKNEKELNKNKNKKVKIDKENNKKNKSKANEKTKEELAKERESRQLKKFAETNPDLYRKLQEDQLIELDGDNTLESFDQGFKEDDRMIKHYAKKLGIKDERINEGIIPDAFKMDGLDYLIDGLNEYKSRKNNNFDYSANIDKIPEIKGVEKLVPDDDELELMNFDDNNGDIDDDIMEEMKRLGADLPSDEEEDDDGMYDLEGIGDDFKYDDEELKEEINEENEDIEEGDEWNGIDEEEDDEVSENNEKTESDLEDDEEDDEEDEEEDEEEEEEEEEEDDDEDEGEGDKKTATEVTPSATQKYIPPHLRKQQASEKSEEYIRLKRIIQGLLNRLSDNNIESIVMEIEQHYRNNSRHDVTEIIIDLILNYISEGVNMNESFILTYAAFLAAIYNIIGMEIGATFVQTTVEKFNKLYDNYLISNIDAEESEDAMAIRKKCINIITFISYIYNFQVVSCILVYDIIKQSIHNFSELDVEVLLKIVKLSGNQLRSDDPLSLKEIITMIQESPKVKDPKKLSLRTKFMIEVIVDLKNNKMKSKVMSDNSTVSEFDKLKKFIGNLIKKRKVYGNEALRVSMDDIKNIKIKGKWWLVGAAWSNDTFSEENIKKMRGENDIATQENELLGLAKKQKMNTEIRKNIFVTIMGSEDCADAYEKLLRLKLKDKQEREIIRVLTYCCGQEKVYNPYYAFIAQKLCFYSHSHKITFQFALWDFLKETINTCPLHKLLNTGKLYAHLIACKSLSMSIFKVVDFTNLSSPRLQLFLRVVILNTLLRINQEQDIREVFDPRKWQSKKKQSFELDSNISGLADGISLYSRKFLFTGLNNHIIEMDKVPELKKKCKILQEALKIRSVIF